MYAQLPSLKQAVILTMSVLSVYLFLQIPFLRSFSLQVFALLVVIYLLLLRLTARRLDIFNEGANTHFVWLNSALLLLTGYSGSLYSIFFVITFIHLFLLSMSNDYKVALLVTLQIMAFHFSLSIAISPNFILDGAALTNLLALPMVSVFYLFAKWQYRRAYYNSLLVDAGVSELRKAKSDDYAVAEFVSNLLNRRLPMLEFLLSFPERNKPAIVSEVKILKQDLHAFLRQLSLDKTKHKQVDQKDKLDDLVEEVSEGT